VHFEVYADSGGHYRWRLKSSNGQTVAVSGESFESESNARRAAQNFKTSASGLPCEVYADSGGHYRWRLQANNNCNIGSSGESFDSRSNAVRACENVRGNAGGASGP
jgi:uncharacterized protein YegP (UPF0339 family)